MKEQQVSLYELWRGGLPQIEMPDGTSRPMREHEFNYLVGELHGCPFCVEADGFRSQAALLKHAQPGRCKALKKTGSDCWVLKVGYQVIRRPNEP